MQQTILVTGGSGGIGRALCLQFAQHGWRVGVHYHQRKAEAEETAARIVRTGGQSLVVQADVRVQHQVEKMIEEIVADSHSLDVVVCNAGIASSRLLLRLATDEWNNVLAINLTGTFHCLRAAGHYMLQQGHGSILVVGSYAALHGTLGQAAYAASKAGLLGLVKSAAREWGRNNIRVNAVLPGKHLTELTGGIMPDAADQMEHVLGRTPDLEDVARSVYRLALARDISGQIWNLDSRIV